MKNARNENVIDSYNVINSVKPKCDLLYLWNRIIVLPYLGHLRECIQKSAERVGIAIRLLLTKLSQRVVIDPSEIFNSFSAKLIHDVFAEPPRKSWRLNSLRKR